MKAMTWVNLEDITLSEMSPRPEDEHCVIPLVGGPKGARSTETESRWGDQGLGRERSEGLMRTEFLFGKLRKSWRCMVNVLNAT